MKEAVQKVDLDQIIVFDRPVKIQGDIIYGFIKSSQIGNEDAIAEYVAYLTGAERYEKQKELVGDDWTSWWSSMENPSNQELETLGYKVFNFEQPIEWSEGEVDLYEGTPCFILKLELIERYKIRETEK